MIRPATSEEASTLTQIALESKSYWGYPEHWLKLWQPELAVSSEFIEKNYVFVFETGGEIRGFYALCINDSHAELEHLWVRPADIGAGVGKELFLDAMERAARLNVGEVQLTADPNAAEFYKKMGAHQIGEARSEIDGQQRILQRMKIDI
jgi:N-acetylglutamate synthase-like GNAT family acetyltransferase